MSNYNFFEPYIKQPEKFNYERVIWMTLVAVSIFLMVILFLTNTFKLSALDTQIADVDFQMTSPEMLKNLREVDEIENTMQQMEGSAAKLMFLNVTTEASNSFTYNIFSELNKKVPENVFLSSVNYAERTMSIRGYSESVENVALLTHQLSSVPTFDMVKVSNMVMENDNYAFDMTAMTPYINTFLDEGLTEEEVDDAGTQGE